MAVKTTRKLKGTQLANKPRIQAHLAEEQPLFACIRCGEEKKGDNFYKHTWSYIWKSTDKKILICKDCINNIMNDLTEKYSEEFAIKTCCAYLDVPYSSHVYQNLAEKNADFHIGMYLRNIQFQQYKGQTFVNCMIDGELWKSEQVSREELVSKWSRADKQNLTYVVSVIGYDPFESSNMTDADRKYCFNILSSYLNMDGVQEDIHKINAIIQITQSHLQCKKLDDIINAEISSVMIDDSRTSKLAATKKSLLESISKAAKDNNIASNYNESSKRGANTLSGKIKELGDNGYIPAEVNMFDINTSEAMKQIADLSNKSIIEQLQLDSNDYTEMILEQRDIILKLEDTKEQLEEENRKIKNEIEHLRAFKQKATVI